MNLRHYTTGQRVTIRSDVLDVQPGDAGRVVDVIVRPKSRREYVIVLDRDRAAGWGRGYDACELQLERSDRARVTP